MNVHNYVQEQHQLQISRCSSVHGSLTAGSSAVTLQLLVLDRELVVVSNLLSFLNKNNRNSNYLNIKTMG